MLSEYSQLAARQLRSALPPQEWDPLAGWLRTFYPFQLEWLLDWDRFSLLNKARQIGASHTYGAAGALWGVLGETTTFVSVGEREATELLKKGTRHAQALHRLGSVWAEPVRATSQEVEFASGGRLVALPATSGGRSYSGNVILDEFAYHEHPEKVWDGASATVLHGFKLRALSTPNGVGNLWHHLYTDPEANKGYRLHEVTIDAARADGLPVDEAECWKMARGDARVYDQLFRCKFLDNDAQYIPSAFVNAAMTENVFVFEGEIYAGLDVGRTNDLTCMVIVALDREGVAFVQSVETRKRTEYEDLLTLVDAAVMGGAVRVCVDATGMGAFPAEQLQRRHGRFRIEPVTFTLPMKEELATGMYQAFADRRLAFARTETGLRDDVCSIRRIITSAGNVRYDAPHTSRGHGDRAWALALALHAAGVGLDKKRYEVREPWPEEMAYV